MTAYTMTLQDDGTGDVLRVGFADLATGDAVMRDAAAAIASLDLKGGRLLRVNGPASLPVAMAIGHAAAHRYGAIACFDPKMSGYIVAISHDPTLPVGSLIDEEE